MPSTKLASGGRSDSRIIGAKSGGSLRYSASEIYCADSCAGSVCSWSLAKRQSRCCEARAVSEAANSCPNSWYTRARNDSACAGGTAQLSRAAIKLNSVSLVSSDALYDCPATGAAARCAEEVALELLCAARVAASKTTNDKRYTGNRS